jgi:hypothetical protein
MANPKVYRSGAKKGLPKKCECGGNMEYAFDFGRVFSVCDTCTPVQLSEQRIQEIVDFAVGRKTDGRTE